MENEGVLKPGSESQDSDEPAPPGTTSLDYKKTKGTSKQPHTPTVGFKLTPSSKGVENAKKRLRAFSIQKKTPITPITVPKVITTPSSSTGNTVYIGKLSGVKVPPPKVVTTEDGEQKKPPKPPRPGMARKLMQDSYTELQKRTLTEIEDMKRKMELVELGIPLGLICPSATNDKAMPTKAMPPIKTFLDSAKLDEIIREAKKAKAEGREFKFDYQKILPDYDNPFQRKKDELEKKFDEKDFRKRIEKDIFREKERRKSDKYEKDSRRHSSHKRDDKDRRRDDRDRYKERSKDRDESKKDKEQTPVAESEKKVEKHSEKDPKETDVNLNDYLVCDSWSLDNDDRVVASPKIDDKIRHIPIPKEAKPVQEKKKEKPETPVKIQKLEPVIDTFKFEIDPNEDEILDMFDESTEIEKFATKTIPRKDDYDSPIQMFDFDLNSKESKDDLTDDNFLESVINEIKQEDMSDDESQTQGLVEYDSPSKDSESPSKDSRVSVTPELDDRMRDIQSSRSDYSDGYRSTESGYKSTESGYKSTEISYKSTESSYKSTESGYKSTESGYKSTESGYKSSPSYKSGDTKGDSYRMSMEKEQEPHMNKSTVDSLETWSFVLKICQPLLFRHDRNKCYRETRSMPKLWFTENPKLCNCVKDRAIVYDELETCKIGLVDRVYGVDQIPEAELPQSRTWYPRFAHCLVESNNIPLVPSSEWEADDSQTETPLVKDKRRSGTPQRSEEIYLDREYQRFMQAVWPEGTDSKAGTPRSTTPVRQEARKKKADKDAEDKKKAKKIKLSSEGWSQESEVDEEQEKSKQKLKIEKAKRKRKHSSTSLSESEDEVKKRRKALKKKAKESKKAKLKIEQRRRLGKKYLKKLKDKQKKKKKQASDEEDLEKETRKKEKKLRKKKQEKKKKAQKKKKAKTKSSSSSSSSTSSSDSESEQEKTKKKKKKELKKKKRKQSTSESTQSEELFDVNILNNIKAERLSDEENNKLEFSPRRQKPREIINVKELQNDFVGNNIHIKQEREEKEVKKSQYELENVEKEFATEKLEDNSSVYESYQEVQLKDIPQPPSSKQVKDSEQTTKKLTEQPRAEKIHSEKLDNNKLDESTSSLSSTNIEKEQHLNIPIPSLPDESTLSQCSSQESIASKDVPYEKDDSHLRPSSQNSNYSFNDVIASHNYQKDEEKFQEFEQGNYEMYEQLAMAYQSDVAKQSEPQSASESFNQSQRIETVVRSRFRGEIKCDWRAGDDNVTPAPNNQRPSRWGLKPGEVNIVLTGGGEDFPVRNEPVYRIQSIANRSDNNSTGSYDEAYEDMYGASDRLQYGDCFGTELEPAPSENKPENKTTHTSTLDDRINQALRTTVLGEVAKDVEEDGDKDGPERGILLTKPVAEARGAKRVSFADGYKPGQDSDVEEPPVRKKKKTRRIGCAWPCPASHPDHVPLWDALPPPPPPPGSPPPFITQQTTIIQQSNNINMMQPNMTQQTPNMVQQPNIMQPNMLQPNMLQPNMMQRPQMLQKGVQPLMTAPPFTLPQKMDGVTLPNFLPPEPPPGLIKFT